MSTNQLAKLTGLNESVDAAVSELVQHNLISDQATGGQCIEVVHDRVADEMTGHARGGANLSADRETCRRY